MLQNGFDYLKYFKEEGEVENEDCGRDCLYRRLYLIEERKRMRKQSKDKQTKYFKA